MAEVGSLKVIRSSHELFVNAVATALPDMRFTPALVGGKKVKQLVMEPFVFQIADSAMAAPGPRHHAWGPEAGAQRHQAAAGSLTAAGRGIYRGRTRSPSVTRSPG